MSRDPLKPRGFAALVRAAPLPVLRVSPVAGTEDSRVYCMNRHLQKILAQRSERGFKTFRKFITWNHKKTVRHTLYRPRHNSVSVLIT